MSKLEKLLEIEGYDALDELLGIFFDSALPGICANDGCDYTAEVEPDQDRASARAAAPTPSRAPLYSLALSSHSLAFPYPLKAPQHFVCRAFLL
jgi:hypothetical protein